MTSWPRALLWDVDGTLAETEGQGHLPAFNQAFIDDGLDWHWDTTLYGRLLTTTGGKERLQRWWRQIDPQAADAPGAAERIARLHARKTTLYVQRVGQGRVALRPGVERLIHEARAAGITQAIATTTTPDNVTALLRATLGEGATGWFSVIGAGDVVPNKKPAPDIYRWVLDRLGLPAADCLAIEDSAAGAAAALAAGLPLLVTRSLYTAGEALPGTPLADLDGLGDDSAAAGGLLCGQPWRGVVTLDVLRQARAQGSAEAGGHG